MTEDDQDLLERLEAIIANAWDEDEHETLSEARDRIEAQAAEIERLRRLLSVQPSNPIAPDPLLGWVIK